VTSNVCVFAAADRAKPIAIVVPTQKALRKLAEDNGILDDGFELLVRSPKVRTLVLRELQATGRKAGLASVEIIDGIVLTDCDWTSQNVSARKHHSFR